MSMIEQRRRLIEGLVVKGVITDPRIESAFMEVPRHAFVHASDADLAYRNEAIPVKIGEGRVLSSSSQPEMMAIMLGQLALEPGQAVLEIGAGTGYNAALMGNLVAPGGTIATVDIDEHLTEFARRNLASVGSRNVTVICGDGALGYAPGAPYDRIIATVGLWDVNPVIAEQLAVGGRMVLPISLHGVQLSIALKRSGDVFESVSIRQCGFMRLRGENAGPEHKISMLPEQGISVRFPDQREYDKSAIQDALGGTFSDMGTGVNATMREVFESLGLWIATHEFSSCDLVAFGSPELVANGPVPCMYEWLNGAWRERVSPSLIADGHIAALGRDRGERIDLDDPTGFELRVRRFGDGSVALAERLAAQVVAWDLAGRPRVEDLRVRVFFGGTATPLTSGETAMVKEHTTVVLADRN